MHYGGPPASSLSVTVHSGRELPAGDAFSKSDPYVKIILGGKEQKTTVKKGKSPVWEQTFTFNYTQESSLKFSLWDKDFIGSDYLAVHDLPLLPILSNPNRHFDGEVSLTHKKGKSAGYLKITVDFYPKGDNTSQTPSPSPTPQPASSGAQTPVPPVQHVVQAQAPIYGVPTPVMQQAVPPQMFPLAQQPQVVFQQQPIYVPVPTQAPPQFVQQPYPQQGYAPQQGYPPHGYPPPQGYPPQQGYAPQQGYPPQQGYAPQQGYPPHGYPPPQGYPPRPY